MDSSIELGCHWSDNGKVMSNFVAKSTDIRSDWTFLRNLTSHCLETVEMGDLIANKSPGTLLENMI